MSKSLILNSDISSWIAEREKAITSRFPNSAVLSCGSATEQADSYVDGCGSTCSGGCYGGCSGDCAGTRK